jgi:hypothetical protein
MLWPKKSSYRVCKSLERPLNLNYAALVFVRLLQLRSHKTPNRKCSSPDHSLQIRQNNVRCTLSA